MEDKVLAVILEVCNDKIVLRKKDINLFETGILDSMGFIELLVSLEEEFNINIVPEEINKEQMSTPNQFVEFIRGKVNG